MVILPWIGILAVGCGNRPGARLTDRALFVAECGRETDGTADELVVLDWHGGVTPLYPRNDFEPLDLSLFNTADGRTLGDDGEAFKERVRREVARILCDSPGPRVAVRNAGDAEVPGGTTVYFTQALSPFDGLVVGEGEYDPCNEQHDNVAVIFGEQIRRLGSGYTFDEWARVFANVAAHETAHTLGYGHVDRDEEWESGRSLFVELMLNGHTISELRREQGFIVEQTSCPDDRRRLRRLDQYPTIICGITP